MEGYLRNRWKMRHFLVFPYPGGAALGPSWHAGVARYGKNNRNGCNGGGWDYTYWGPGG